MFCHGPESLGHRDDSHGRRFPDDVYVSCRQTN